MAKNNNNEINITFKAFNKNFNSAIKEMDDQTKQLRQEMKLQEEQMKHTASSTDKLEAKVNSLQQIYDVQRKKTQQAADALERAKQLWGENSKEVAKMTAQLKRQQIAEQQAANAVTESQQAFQRAQEAQKNQQKSLKQLNNLLQVTGSSLGDFSDLLGQELTQAIRNGTASSAQLEKAFKQVAGATQSVGVDVEQVRQALSQLDNGATVQSVRTALQALSTITATAEDEVKQLQQALKLQQEQMKHSVTESQKLQANLSGLEGIYEALRRATSETEQALAQARSAYGENSQEAKKLETQLSRNQIAEQQMANSVREARQAQEQHATSLTQLNRLFDATGTSVDRFANEIGTDLVNAIREGRASASQLDSAFNQISRSALGANTDLNQVQQTLRTLDNGSSITDVRQELGRLQQEANQAQESVQDVGNELQALGGILAGAGVAGAVAKALDVDDLKAKVDVTFDVPESSKASIREALVDVKKYGVDGEEALEGLRRQFALNKDASDASNAAIVKGAAAISYAYSGIDFTELIQETNEIGKELKISDQEALDLVNSLLKIGFPPEQLDIIAEYGSQLRRAGYEANEIKGILAAASGVNSWNIDNLLDGLKEGRIKATEMGRGLSESFKDSLRDVVGSTNKVSEEQISAMETNFANQEKSLFKSLSRRYDAISKSYEKQKKALQKSLEQQYEAVEDSYEDKEEALEKSLENAYEAQVKSYEKSLEKLEKSLDQEVKAFEKASDDRIALIDKEYTEKLKLIDEEKYRQIKAIENQINNIDKVSAAEEKARNNRENASKRAELQEKIRTAKDAKSKQEAYKTLKDFDERLRVEKIKEERQAQIDALKEEKESINDSFDKKREALKEETENRKEETKNAIEVEKEALSERQAAEKKAFIESNKERLKLLKENQTAELNNFREVNAEKLSALGEEHQRQQELLNERLSAELSAVQESHQAQLESYRAMHQQKMELAKNPPDSSQFKAIEQQLEAWGAAIAKGGEEGSQAFEDMVKWLNSIEDATLQNAIGVELFGTMWEDQGQNIIDSVLNADDALTELEKTEKSVNDLAKQAEDTSGLIQLREALENLLKSLDPLFTVIANVVGALANWASNNPTITAAIVAVGSAIGILIGAFAAIGPALLGVVALFGGGTGGTGLLGILSKLGPFLLTLGSKILPALRIAFGALTGPVGWIITALTIAVPLIIKHWDSISEFFANLWKGIVDIFKKSVDGIVNFLKQWGPTLLAVLTGPIGLLVALVIKNWDAIKTKTSEIFGRVRETTKSIFQSIFTNTVGKITSLKDRAVEIFGKLKDGITRPIEKARDAIKNAIDKIKSFFHFNFKWPELKMPKFKIKKGSLNPMKWFSEGFPEIDIEWFAKGGVMTSPTLFGGSGNTAFVGGEAGPEAVLPLNERVLGAIGNAIYAATGKDISGQQTVYNFEKMLDGAVFHVREEADIKKVARELGDYTKVRERGGRR
ncbi:tape measure protein [Psychrobacillus sp. FSL K6-2843]|uniref:tape measure protein n=1 Tax=Psychrobacillus sp. FSL K6-2843 TaxID=2921549 RepID=UPI003159E8B2